MNLPFYQFIKLFYFCWKDTFLSFIKSSPQKQVKISVKILIGKTNKMIIKYTTIGSNSFLLEKKKVSSFKPFSRREWLNKKVSILMCIQQGIQECRLVNVRRKLIWVLQKKDSELLVSVAGCQQVSFKDQLSNNFKICGIMKSGSASRTLITLASNLKGKWKIWIKILKISVA